MSMKWVGRPNHNILLDPSELPSESPTVDYRHCDRETKYISGGGCFLMIASHSRRCGNALNMYEVDLV